MLASLSFGTLLELLTLLAVIALAYGDVRVSFRVGTLVIQRRARPVTDASR
jgi:hypothetical protein